MIPGEASPAALCRRLFVQGGGAEVEARVEDLRVGRSVLDLVNDSARRLQKDLGPRDRERLDQYFMSGRDLEGELMRAEEWDRRPKPTVATAAPQDVTEHPRVIERTS